MKDYFEGKHVEWTDLNKDEREKLRPIVGGILVAVFLFLVLLFVFPVRATEIPMHVIERQGVSIRLMRGPCADPASSIAIAVNLPQYVQRFRAIESTWPMQDGSRKDFAGCWGEFSKEESGAPGAVLVLVFSDGQHYTVLKDEILKKGGGA